ncbi:hypothetical protein, partial [Stakelama sediminis]|uniref:hypothetical protein n=1 Tax=Stakelama sediminis TaxID=463200 RepID=UPI001C84B9FC
APTLGAGITAYAAAPLGKPADACIPLHPHKRKAASNTGKTIRNITALFKNQFVECIISIQSGRAECPEMRLLSCEVAHPVVSIGAGRLVVGGKGRQQWKGASSLTGRVAGYFHSILSQCCPRIRSASIHPLDYKRNQCDYNCS